MIFAIFLSILAGIFLVLNRNFNAKLAERCSTEGATLYNYITGIIGSIIIMLVFFEPEISIKGLPFYVFLGGFIGMISVFLSALVAPRMNQVIMSLLVFIAQVFFGLLLDYIIDGTFCFKALLGGLFALAGLFFLNMDK